MAQYLDTAASDEEMTDATGEICSSAIMKPNMSAFSLEVEVARHIQMDSEAATCYDPNRRSSLGAESLLEHDISEEGSLECEGVESLLLVEAQLGLEYADDIFHLNRMREKAFHPKGFIVSQPQVTEHMRCTIVHWLTKLNRQLKFNPETAFVAVSFIDRFLSCTPLAQDCLQLLAVSALFLASKMEESNLPCISSLVSLCGTAYKHHHFRRMEALLLTTLEFRLLSPTSWFFVTHLTLKTCHLALLDRRMLSLARYVIETCLASYEVAHFFPSVQAAAALVYSCISLYIPEYLEAVLRKVLGLDLYLDRIGSDVSSSLQWVINRTFTEGELNEISICLVHMTKYMRPFLEVSPLECSPPSSFFATHVLPTLQSQQKGTTLVPGASTSWDTHSSPQTVNPSISVVQSYGCTVEEEDLCCTLHVEEQRGPAERRPVRAQEGSIFAGLLREEGQNHFADNDCIPNHDFSFPFRKRKLSASRESLQNS